MTETRKLRNIIFADIAGYTAMMQADEPRSLKVLNQFKEQVETQVPQHQGEIVQYFGDACLLSFESTTQAVACSLQLQTFFIPNDVPVRIGMHLGEVVFKNNNAFGDGVNIASRIESMGIPGAILLSKAIRDQIKNKPEFPVALLGSYHFKNIEAPMDLYALSSEGLVVPKKGEMKGKLAPTAPEKGFLLRFWEKRITRQIGIPLMILSLSILGYFMLRSVEANAMTKTITFVNADGVEETREIVKEEFRKEVVLFSFEPIDEQDKSNAWIGLGMTDRLVDALDQDKYLAPIDYWLPFDRARDFAFFSKVEKLQKAKNHRGDYYVEGHYQVTDSQYILVPAICDKRTGVVLKEKRIVGEDLFQVLDSCVAFIRQTTGLSATQLAESPILGFREMYTGNFEALKAYSTGGSARTFPSTLKMEKAIELDSTFVYPSLRIAQRLLFYSSGEVESRVAIDRAMRHRRRLPYQIQIEVMVFKHIIYEEWEKAEKLVQIQLEIDPGEEFYHYLLSLIYNRTSQIDKLIVHHETFYETHPSMGTCFGAANAALLAGDPEKAIQILQYWLTENPRQTSLLSRLASAYIHQRDYQKARETFEKIILIEPETELNIAKSMEAVTYMENHNVPPEDWARFEGSYLSDNSEMVIDIRFINGHLYFKANNQEGFFMYPAGESLFSYGFTAKGFRNEFVENSQGKIYGLKRTENYQEREYSYFSWKQDTLIQNAELLLEQGDYENARIAYEAALDEHPEHYYLRQDLEHIDYMQNTSAEGLQANYQRLAGPYGKTLKVWVENGSLFIKSAGTVRLVLQPLTDLRFQCSRPYLNYEFVEEGGQIKGIQILRHKLERKTWEVDSKLTERRGNKD